MFANITKCLCGYICIIVLLFPSSTQRKHKQNSTFLIDWTAPAVVGSDCEPWHTGITCHFYRKNKITQIDCILIVWQGKDML